MIKHADVARYQAENRTNICNLDAMINEAIDYATLRGRDYTKITTVAPADPVKKLLVDAGYKVLHVTFQDVGTEIYFQW